MEFSIYYMKISGWDGICFLKRISGHVHLVQKDAKNNYINKAVGWLYLREYGYDNHKKCSTLLHGWCVTTYGKKIEGIIPLWFVRMNVECVQACSDLLGKPGEARKKHTRISLFPDRNVGRLQVVEVICTNTIGSNPVQMRVSSIWLSKE